jgi:hypothetical protein
LGVFPYSHGAGVFSWSLMRGIRLRRQGRNCRTYSTLSQRGREGFTEAAAARLRRMAVPFETEDDPEFRDHVRTYRTFLRWMLLAAMHALIILALLAYYFT